MQPKSHQTTNGEYICSCAPIGAAAKLLCREKGQDVNGLFVTDGFTFFQHEKNATFMVVECTFCSLKIGKLAVEMHAAVAALVAASATEMHPFTLGL